MGGLLYTVAVILVAIWLIGFLFAHVASPLIHLLLVIAVIVVIFQLLTGRRTI